MSRSTWTLDQIPDLTGKRAVVTGVTGGLGEHTAVELARHGAEVVMSARTETRLAQVIEDVRSVVPTASLVPLVMDLADLTSVRRAAAQAATLGPAHILVNNAGIMATPNRRTVDGFDLQMGTNHFGHFAFTGLLLPRLVEGEARVVTVSSMAHRGARSVPLTDPRVPSGHYRKWGAYAESKLANLLFAFELDRRSRAAGTPVTSVAAHPGYASTNLVRGGLRLEGRTTANSVIEGFTRLVGQSAAQGALPLLMAATEQHLPGMSYVGPDGLGEVRGRPVLVGATKAARDELLAKRFWELSEQATGVTSF